MPATTTCKNTEKVAGDWSGAFTTAQGQPATVEGPTTVSVVSGDGTFIATGDHTGEFVSGTAAGPTVYSLSADADLGTGQEALITDTVTLTVTAEQAANFGITFAAPVPK